MIATNLYYTAPNDLIFQEMKDACIEVWKQYDDTHSYVTAKLERINQLENVQDNFMSLMGMFDVHNQRKVIELLSEETISAFKNRLVSVDNYQWCEVLGI